MRNHPIVGLIVAALLLPAAPAAADLLDDVKARGKLLVGVSDTSPPFSFKRHGESKVVGYDLDLVHSVGKRLGVPVETVSVGATDRIPLLQQGKLDFVATSMTRTTARLRDVDFSAIYFVTPHAVVVKKSSGITSVRQLAGRKASSGAGSTAGDNLKDAVPEVNIVYVKDYTIAFAAMKDGSVDAFTTDDSVLRALVQQDSRPEDFLILSDFTKSRNVGFAMKKNEPRFKDAINRALLDVEASGEAAKIFDAWFGPGSDMPLKRTFKIQAD